MLNVIICDDNVELLEKIKKVVQDHILINDIHDIKLELATTNPNEVLNLFVEKEFQKNGKEKLIIKPLKQRILFLDINFVGEDVLALDGIMLGSEIRKYDVESNIVFITNSGSERRDVIEKQTTPLGYVQKRFTDEELVKIIIGFLETARERIYIPRINRKMIQFKTGRSTKHVNLADIYYVKGNNKKEKDNADEVVAKGKTTGGGKTTGAGKTTGGGLAILYTMTGEEKLTKSLKSYDDTIPELIRLGKSYLINPLNVKETRSSAKRAKVLMANGTEIAVERELFDAYEEDVRKMYEQIY